MDTDAGPEPGDAFGRALLDRLEGRGSAIVIERDDGFVDVDQSNYFGQVDDDALWPWIRPRLGNRVLDLGAGAGRAAIRLQAEGIEVTALDVSPGCVEVCARRGVQHTFLGTIEDLAEARPQAFDAVVALGNNLGLIGTPERAAGFFDAARRVGTEDLRIVGTMLDPYRTEHPVHLAYHRRNRGAGRLGGNVRVRVRYEDVATDWFDLLWASPEELADLCAAHHWTVAATHPSGILYAAELRPA